MRVYVCEGERAFAIVHVMCISCVFFQLGQTITGGLYSFGPASGTKQFEVLTDTHVGSHTHIHTTSQGSTCTAQRATVCTLTQI